MQNEQFEESEKKNEELSDVVGRLEEELSEALKQKEEADDRTNEIADLLSRMDAELSSLRNGQSAKDQVEELRKKVNEMAKGEIERIEFIVSEFD
jgi:predicted  nucleic acid-binding Zn-ribbon protein